MTLTYLKIFNLGAFQKVIKRFFFSKGLFKLSLQKEVVHLSEIQRPFFFLSSEFFSIRTSTDFFIRTLAWLYRDSIWIPIPIYQYTDTDDTEVGRVNHSKKKSPTPLKKVTKKSQKIKISQTKKEAKKS